MSKIKELSVKAVMPLLYINLLGMLIGGGYLFAVGTWRIVLSFLILLTFSSYIIPIILIPAGILSHFMVLYQNAKQAAKEKLMFVLAMAYMLAFITLWCGLIFGAIVGSAGAVYKPLALVFAVSAAMAPIFLWVRHDPNNFFIIMLAEVTQLAMVILAVILLVYKGMTLSLCLTFIFSVLCLAVVFQWFFEKRLTKKPSQS